MSIFTSRAPWRLIFRKECNLAISFPNTCSTIIPLYPSCSRLSIRSYSVRHRTISIWQFLYYLAIFPNITCIDSRFLNITCYIMSIRRNTCSTRRCYIFRRHFKSVPLAISPIASKLNSRTIALVRSVFISTYYKTIIRNCPCNRRLRRIKHLDFTSFQIPKETILFIRHVGISTASPLTIT